MGSEYFPIGQDIWRNKNPLRCKIGKWWVRGKKKLTSIIIFGAGIAGLSAAHELIDLGYNVTVYEALDQPGGFFRSSRHQETNMPTEYSWHGFGPWYHNTFDLFKKIPFYNNENLYDAGLSRTIDFGIFPDDAKAQFYDRGLRSISRMFRMNPWEFTCSTYLMMKTWTANQRSKKIYSTRNAAGSWQPFLGTTSYRTWRSCFGPWIGSDWAKVGLHTTGDFFRKQLTTKPVHHHKADHNGPAWSQGAGDGWLLLKGPSSEYLFQPWVNHLKEKGVVFHWQKQLTKLEFDGRKIISAACGDESIIGDVYIMAINPFITAEVLAKTPDLEKQDVLNKFQSLVQDGPHRQVSFRLAFAEKIKLPRKRMAVVVSDSEFNLTLFAQEQVWDEDVDLGQNVQSLWTGTSCISGFPGRIYGKPVETCTKEEFIEEVKAQILSCGALDHLIQEANGGKSLRDFPIREIEVWHEWEFSADGIKDLQPKWVNSTTTQPFVPSQITPVSNLFLAGAHTTTQAHVWSIEGAVESGRRAAKAIDGRVQVIDQYIPSMLRITGRIDDLLFAAKGPHVLDTAAVLVVISVLWLIF